MPLSGDQAAHSNSRRLFITRRRACPSITAASRPTSRLSANPPRPRCPTGRPRRWSAIPDVKRAIRSSRCRRRPDTPRCPTRAAPAAHPPSVARWPATASVATSRPAQHPLDRDPVSGAGRAGAGLVEGADQASPGPSRGCSCCSRSPSCCSAHALLSGAEPDPLSIESWSMVVFITAVLWFTGESASPLLNLYLLPIILSALTLGRSVTLAQVAVIALCHVLLAAATPAWMWFRCLCQPGRRTARAVPAGRLPDHHALGRYRGGARAHRESGPDRLVDRPLQPAHVQRDLAARACGGRA